MFFSYVRIPQPQLSLVDANITKTYIQSNQKIAYPNLSDPNLNLSFRVILGYGEELLYFIALYRKISFSFFTNEKKFTMIDKIMLRNKAATVTTEPSRKICIKWQKNVIPPSVIYFNLFDTEHRAVRAPVYAPYIVCTSAFLAVECGFTLSWFLRL